MNYYGWGWPETLASCLITLILCIVFGALGGVIFMALWNWIAPIFWVEAPQLSFLQAWGVIILLSWIGSFFRSKSK